jgi:glycosyltransferase involved in cell wall biosynthesis
LATACLELLADPARVAALGGAARERVASSFTLALCLQRYRSLYAELMDTDGPLAPSPRSLAPIVTNA